MSQIFVYGGQYCFSQLDRYHGSYEDIDDLYSTDYYTSLKSFTIPPKKEVVIILRSCGSYWFRSGLIHHMKMINNQFVTTRELPHQLAMLIRNYSDETFLHVEEGSLLSGLLSQPELLFKLVSVSLSDLHHIMHQPTEPIEQENSEEDEGFEVEEVNTGGIQAEAQDAHALDLSRNRGAEVVMEEGMQHIYIRKRKY
jgi:hypothetical protein